MESVCFNHHSSTNEDMLKRLKISWSTEREVFITLAIVLVLVSIGGLIAYRQVAFYATTLAHLDRSRQIAGSAESVYRNLLSAETSQRNYLITGESIYFETYAQSVENIQNTRARLLTLIDNDTTLVEGVDGFIAGVDEKLNELANTLEIRDADGFAAARTALETSANTVLMADIRDWLEALIQSETDSFVSLRDRIAKRVSFTVVMATALLTLILSLVVTVYMLVRRAVRAHHAFEARLSQSLRRERELNELKSHFVRTVSHEFRTPLAVIQTSTDLLNRYGFRMSEAQRQHHMDKLQNQVTRLTSLIEDALTVQRSQVDELPYAPEIYDLRELCHNAIESLKTDFAERDIRLTVNGTGFAGSVDSRLMSQALGALLLNAVRYSNADTPVEVVLTCAPDVATIAIIDQGIGIPVDEHGLLFDLFFRGRNAIDIPGTGLGLAVARSIVERHQGRIHVDSTPGVGSTFTVELPWLQSSVAGAA